jgi:hypothetical protein
MALPSVSFTDYLACLAAPGSKEPKGLNEVDSARLLEEQSLDALRWLFKSSIQVRGPFEW